MIPDAHRGFVREYTFKCYKCNTECFLMHIVIVGNEINSNRLL